MEREENIKIKYAQDFANHLTKMLSHATSGQVLLSVSEKLILIDETKRYFDLLTKELYG